MGDGLQPSQVQYTSGQPWQSLIPFLSTLLRGSAESVRGQISWCVDQCNMSWNKHILDLARRANYTLGLLHCNLRHCPHDVKTTAYFLLVRSTMEYCAPIWEPYLDNHKSKLEINHRGARFVCNRTNPAITSVSPSCKGATWVGPYWRPGDATWGLFFTIRSTTSWSHYHPPNFAHQNAVHTQTTKTSIRLSGPTLNHIKIYFTQELYQRGIAFPPKPLTVRRQTILRKACEAVSIALLQLHRRDIPHGSFPITYQIQIQRIWKLNWQLWLCFGQQ